MISDTSKTEEKPLLDWLMRKHPDTPKVRAKKWIIAGRVSVNSVVIRQPHRMIPDPGNTLELRGHGSSTLECGSGWQIHPRVALLHLDAALAVVNKGPGLIAVPAPNCKISALSILADVLAGDLRPRDTGGARKVLPSAYRHIEPLPVHRLDQYTTGLFCMATNPAARQHLIDQLKAHTMKREYIAFAEGRAQSPTGTWRQWLQLSRDELRQHVVSEAEAKAHDGQEAITHYEVIAEYPIAGGKGFVTKLRLRLETGRKHQIRVQAAHAGLPLIGDRIYNASYRGAGRAIAPIDFPRQALHAIALNLEHPNQPGTRMSWTANLPKDLVQLEAALRSSRV